MLEDCSRCCSGHPTWFESQVHVAIQASFRSEITICRLMSKQRSFLGSVKNEKQLPAAAVVAAAAAEVTIDGYSVCIVDSRRLHN